MLFGIDTKLPYFNTGIVHFMSQKMWEVHVSLKQLLHFVKTDFDELPKEGSKQRI